MKVQHFFIAMFVSSTFAFAGTAQAQFGGFTFPTITWPDSYQPSNAKTAICPQACSKKGKK